MTDKPKIDDGGLMFPLFSRTTESVEGLLYHRMGIAFRGYLAGEAMGGLIAGRASANAFNEYDASACVAAADLMIAALDPKP